MCEVIEESLKACLWLLELFVIRGDEMEERGRGWSKKDEMQDPGNT